MLAFWRSFFAALILIPFVRRPRWTARMAPLVSAFSLMTAVYLSAIVLTTAANAIWLQATAPAWVFLLGRFFMKETAKRGDRVLLLFGAVGVALILSCEITSGAVAGVTCGVVSGVLFAIVMMSLRALRDQDSFWLISLCHTATVIVLLPIVCLWGQWPSLAQLPYLAALGIFQMGIPYVLFARGVRLLHGNEAAGLTLLEPVLNPLWVFLAWGEVPAWWTIVGAACILAGLVTRYATEDS